MATVVGIGQASWDYLMLVDEYPERDTKKEVLSFVEEGGGPVATALVTLSRLGVRCRFYGVVGEDREGGKIRDSLEREGISTTGLLVREGESSQIAFIVVEEKTGKRTIFWKRPTGRPLIPGEMDEGFLDGAGFLLLDGLMDEVSLWAAGRARERGVPVMLDAGRVRPGMLETARLSDYLVCSEEFAREVGYRDDPEGFSEIIRREGFPVTTITLGEKGSITFKDDGFFHTPAFKVKAVDTTGAGDVFHGGYIYGLLQGWDIRETVRFASACAALKCRKMGGRRGIPTLEEAISLMESSVSEDINY